MISDRDAQTEIHSYMKLLKNSEAEVERLRQEVETWRFNFNEAQAAKERRPEVAEVEGLREELEFVRAERDRFRAALEEKA